MRLHRQIGASHAAKRIGLTDQPREFGQRIAFAPGRRMLIIAVIVVVIGGKKSVLISISHRDHASPSGKPPTHPLLQTNRLLPDTLTRAQTSPQGSAEHAALVPVYRISTGASTPRTASPDARTETTPWTSASRAFVIS